MNDPRPNSPDDNPRAALPGVDAVLRLSDIVSLSERYGRDTVAGWVRATLDDAREELEASPTNDDRPTWMERIAGRVSARAEQEGSTRLGRVINATGVVLHTGLGRAPLSAAAREALLEVAGAVNVELDLATNTRRSRGHQILPTLRQLTGCEDALIVNNNAAATLLTLQALCAGRDVVISRGQLVEIGGSFRLPDIFALSGAKLKEVGTTNRTRLTDYEAAIGPETAAIMRVHPSNYRIEGFTSTPSTTELAALAQRKNLLMIDDIGSGSLIDVTAMGLPAEPTFAESLAAGADVVLGSGDKLLGGPQAGIILGKAAVIERLRSHPLARALRVGKLTLAALAATLESYQRSALAELPLWQMLSASPDELRHRAESLLARLRSFEGEFSIRVEGEQSTVGGGSLPGVMLLTSVIAIRHPNVACDALATRLRTGTPRIVPRIQNDAVLIDLRSVLPEDDDGLHNGVMNAIADNSS